MLQNILPRPVTRQMKNYLDYVKKEMMNHQME